MKRPASFTLLYNMYKTAIINNSKTTHRNYDKIFQCCKSRLFIKSITQWLRFFSTNQRDPSIERNYWACLSMAFNPKMLQWCLTNPDSAH